MKALLTALLALVVHVTIGQTMDTFEVHFALRETSLNKKIESDIDKLIKKGKIASGQKIMLLGLADFRGTGPHNDTVSAERANSVQNYLLVKGFSKSDITLCIGKGKIDRPGMTSVNGYAPDRKVQIIVPSAPTKLDARSLKVNETVTLNNIFFEGGLPDILGSSMPELDNLYGFLKDNPGVKIAIEGHVCCKGIATVNEGPYSDDKVLSELRAKAIYKYMVSKGIQPERMKYVGYGTTRPKVYPARTSDEQQQNRRVEVRILSK